MTNQVSRAGFGKPGYCALCSFKDELLLNERIKSGWNARQVNDWLSTHYDGLSFNRQTIYNHKNNHLGRAEDRIVAAAEKVRAREANAPRVATNEQFLEAVRDIGFQRAMQNPDEVTIDHALKASSIIASQKQSGNNITIILAKLMTGASQTFDVIEGEARELPQLEAGASQ